MVQRLRELREREKLSQEKLGTILDISARRISAYESSKMEPDISVLKQIANFFGVSIDYLTGNDCDEPNFSNEGSPLNLKRFGFRIREFRKNKGIPQNALAETVGISASYLNLIENGTKTPSMDICITILNALKMSADAAFMDSLEAGLDLQTTLLQHKMLPLSPDKRALALVTFDALVDALL